MNEYKHAIVVTGSIGVGKSTVCEMLKHRGYEIIDADEISHKILDKLSVDISNLFGDKFIKDGKVLRKELASLVFNDQKQLKKLEELLHPKIKEEILIKALNLEKEGKYYFVDIPLFFESKNYNEFDKVLVIYTPKELIIDRIMRRNNLTRYEALVRINLQIDIEKKKNLANFVIENSGSKKDLEKKIDEFLVNLDEW